MSFRIRPLQRVLSSIGLLLMIGAWLVSVFVVRIFLPITGSFASSGFYILQIIIFVELIVGTVWFGWMFLAANKATLVVQNDHVEYKTIRNLGFLTPAWLRSFRLEFKDITFIRTGTWLYQWEVSSMTSKPVNIFPLIFGKTNAEKIAELFQQYLPPERVEKDLIVFEPQKQKGYKWQIVFGIAIIIMMFLTLLLDPAHTTPRSWLNNAWDVKMRLPAFDSAWIFSAETSDDFWILTSDFQHPHRVYHQKAGRITTWDMPELEKDDIPALVSGDQNGNPIVWFDDKTLHYVNDHWQTAFYEGKLDISGLWYTENVINKERGWFVIEQNKVFKFIELNTLTGEWTEIALPEKMLQDGFEPQDVRRTADDDLLVRFGSVNEQRMFVMSDTKWQRKEYIFNISKNQRVWDYFIGDDGFLWVLIGDFENQQVQRISSEGDVKTTHIPMPDFGKNDIEYYSNLIIDSRHRMWLGGGYPNFIAVFTPLWDEEAATLVTYTPRNSNYQSDTGGRQVYFINEEILSADDWVVSINTNTETLPAPLPDWLTKLNMHIVRLFIFLICLPVALISFTTTKNLNYNKMLSQS